MKIVLVGFGTDKRGRQCRHNPLSGNEFSATIQWRIVDIFVAHSLTILMPKIVKSIGLVPDFAGRTTYARRENRRAKKRV